MLQTVTETVRPAEPTEGLWDVERTARFLAVCPSWVRDHSSGQPNPKRPVLPCKRISARKLRFDPVEVRRFMEGL